MPGILRDDIVTVQDQKEGSTLYNRGNYGYPMSGGGVELDLLEATYLAESKRLSVTDGDAEIGFEELFMHSSAVHDDFDIRYMVYRDIRQRGFVIKANDSDLSVFPRGMTVSNSRPQYIIKAVSERTAQSIRTFCADADDAESKGKQLLYGIVDEEGDVTYYAASSRTPSGDIPVEGGKAAAGKLVRDRVFVFGPDTKRIYENGMFGKDVAGMLQLSLIESCYLSRCGLLNVISPEKEMDSDELEEFSDSVQNEFRIRFKAFSDMRGKGLLAKTGFKYGTHFRVYEKHPDKCHARYLAHAVESDTEMTWPEISRTVRLAGGVKKELLFCCVSTDVRYLEFKWFRP